MKKHQFKTVALSLVLLSVSLASYSQEVIDRPDKTSLSFGVAGGANASTLSSADPSLNPSFGFRLGGQVGVAANLRFGLRGINSTASDGKFGLQAEAAYSMMGANLGDEGGIGLGYLTVPMLFQYYPTTQFYLEVGPQACLNLTHTPDHTSFGDYNLNLTSLKANDVAAVVGVGLARKQIHVGVRYVMGMSDLASNLAWRNQCAQVHLTFLFGAGTSSSASKKSTSKTPDVVQPITDDFDF